MPKKEDLTGKVFNKLTVIKEAEPRYTPKKQKLVYWLCKCECGTVKEIRAANLKNNDIQSCGCLNRENAKEKAANMYKYRKIVKSIQKGSRNWREYKVWRSMCDRCTNPNSTVWKYYGGRGIQVCKRWLDSFDNFFYDIGPIPKGLEIDRYPDMNGNYTPNNIRLATRSENIKNRDYSLIMSKRKRNNKGQFK